MENYIFCAVAKIFLLLLQNNLDKMSHIVFTEKERKNKWNCKYLRLLEL